MIEYSVLENWPDVGQLEAAARDLRKGGSEFALFMNEGHSRWKALSWHYETPHQELLYAALDSAEQAGQAVAASTASVAKTLETFASLLSGWEMRRKYLIADAEEMNRKQVPEDADEAAEHEKAKEELQHKINQLGRDFAQAVEECAADIENIDANGTIRDPATGALLEFALGVGLTFVEETGKSTEVHTYRSRTTLITGANGRPGNGEGLRPRDQRNIKIHSDPRSFHEWSVKDIYKGDQRYLQQESTKVRPWKLGQTVGRAAGVAGGVMTYGGEFSKAQERYAAENPGLSEGERNAKAAETAAARAGAQIGVSALASLGASAAAGAVLGTFVPVPVVGTLAGIVAGVAVGTVMAIPTGEGKTVGDRVGDFGESVWEGIKGHFQ